MRQAALHASANTNLKRRQEARSEFFPEKLFEQEQAVEEVSLVRENCWLVGLVHGLVYFRFF